MSSTADVDSVCFLKIQPATLTGLDSQEMISKEFSGQELAVLGELQRLALKRQGTARDMKRSRLEASGFG